MSLWASLSALSDSHSRADWNLLEFGKGTIWLWAQTEGGCSFQRQESIQETWNHCHSYQVWHLLHSQIPQSGRPGICNDNRFSDYTITVPDDYREDIQCFTISSFPRGRMQELFVQKQGENYSHKTLGTSCRHVWKAAQTTRKTRLGDQGTPEATAFLFVGWGTCTHLHRWHLLGFPWWDRNGPRLAHKSGSDCGHRSGPTPLCNLHRWNFHRQSPKRFLHCCFSIVWSLWSCRWPLFTACHPRKLRKYERAQYFPAMILM